MTRCVVPRHLAQLRLSHWMRLVFCLTALTALAACGGGHPTQHARVRHNPSRYYPPPGPPSDPWGPYIHEASGRFGIPELWIRGVMRQESGGQEDVISWAGAMGLMQVMPDTYEGLRDRYSLGDDPFDPHNNILAGTAYLREMYDRFGAPGFLAAYNAGPNRVDSYLSYGAPLPVETVNYVAAIAPGLGPGTPMSGPLAVYGGGTRMAARSTPSGCDPDAAYNPNGPCTPLRAATVQTAVMASAASPPVYAAAYRSGGCDPDAAYDPAHPCQPTQSGAAASPAVYPVAYRSGACDPDAAYDPSRPCPPSGSAPVQSASPVRAGACDPDAAYDPSRPCQPVSASPSAAGAAAPTRFGCDTDAAYDPAQPCVPVPAGQTAVVAEALPPPASQPRSTRYGVAARPARERMAQSVAFTPGPPPGPPLGRWAIQVGAFASLSTAENAAEAARSALPDILRTAKIELPATSPFGSQVAFRARLFGLSPSAAADACARLTRRGTACMTVPPPRDGL